MKKFITAGLIIAAVMLMFTGCSLEYGDSYLVIDSVSVEPDHSTLIDGYEYDFTVKVSYKNTTMQTATVGVYINNGVSVNTYKNYDEEISVGWFEEGTATFTFTTEAKDWGYDGDLQLYADLYGPQPLFGDWVSIAYDWYTFTTGYAR
ncbi:MAG: hypothetical protein PQJ61_12540 [Spirochaetales bacterium]|uniref:Uncharacterized protein n=1 Tax=Candidatus Thalassospirochaeta sargassi TaxID=3119039 RepID=A0AAJ1MNC5_9SPIO|nr:hypothetical protein [Spirochaetales bacterium]